MASSAGWMELGCGGGPFYTVKTPAPTAPTVAVSSDAEPKIQKLLFSRDSTTLVELANRSGDNAALHMLVLRRSYSCYLLQFITQRITKISHAETDLRNGQYGEWVSRKTNSSEEACFLARAR
jgi:hypothetical protein